MLVPVPSQLYISLAPADFRKSFDGLAGLVRNSLGRQPEDGSLYVFFNRRRDQVKVLYYHQGGLCLWAKRLEQGVFARLKASCSVAYVILTPTEVLMLLDGIQLEGRKRQKRYKK